MAYESTHITNIAQLKLLAERVKAQLTTAIGALPEELFLDQLKTKFETKFNFAGGNYTGATDPGLDNKPVMVLAVKGDQGSLTYSFLDMSALVDTYSAADNSVEVSGYTLKVKVDPAADNAISVTANGLKADISGKADKVSGATAGNFAGLDANGNLTDSGKSASDFVAAESGKRLLTDAEAAKLTGITEGATKVEASSTNGNIKINGTETVVYTLPVATDAEVTEMLDEVFGAASSGN